MRYEFFDLIFELSVQFYPYTATHTSKSRGLREFHLGTELGGKGSEAAKSGTAPMFRGRIFILHQKSLSPQISSTVASTSWLFWAKK